MKNEKGFTIVELMTALVIAGVLITLAIPSFTTLIKNNRLTTQANELVAAINYARSEAIKRGVSVSLCRSADGQSCATSGGWEQGWIVFTDLNENGDYDDTASPADELVRVMDGLQGQNTLTPDGSFTDNLTITFQGFSTDTGTFVLCDDRDGDGDTGDSADFNSGKAISVSLTGRVSTTDASDSSFTNCVTP